MASRRSGFPLDATKAESGAVRFQKIGVGSVTTTSRMMGYKQISQHLLDRMKGAFGCFLSLVFSISHTFDLSRQNRNSLA